MDGAGNTVEDILAELSRVSLVRSSHNFRQRSLPDNLFHNNERLLVIKEISHLDHIVLVYLLKSNNFVVKILPCVVFFLKLSLRDRFHHKVSLISFSYTSVELIIELFIYFIH